MRIEKTTDVEVERRRGREPWSREDDVVDRERDLGFDVGLNEVVCAAVALRIKIS
jgi:hypothetical protein